MILGLRQRKHKMRLEHLGVPESKKLLNQKKKKKGKYQKNRGAK